MKGGVFVYNKSIVRIRGAEAARKELFSKTISIPK